MKKLSPLLCSILVLILAGLFFSGCRRAKTHVEKYRFPGEFEKQQAIWIQWPSEIYNTGDRPVNPVMVNIIKALAPFIRVNVIARSTEEILKIKNLFRTSGFSGTNVHFYTIYHESIWARDVGPIFVKDGKNKLKVADFGFNNYSRDGNPYYINAEGRVDRLAAQELKLPTVKTNLISEGGAIESNGRGTLMTTEAVALARNPAMSKLQIAKEYQRVLGVRKVIWLKKGLAEDDRITGGHINEMARFAVPHTILLAQVLPGEKNVSPISRINYRRLEENYRILRSARDQDGKPFRIIRIPLPPTFYGDPENQDGTIVRSYLNYAVTNGAVLIQTYWRPGRSPVLKSQEDKALSIFRKVFPGRKIIGIDAENVNRWGGGIHCITQHMPAG